MSDQVRLRAADDDRDQMAARLREAHALGQLDAVEFDQRLDKALQARYLDDLDGLVVDLPAPRTPATVNPSLPVVSGAGRAERGVSVMGGRRLRPSRDVTAVGVVNVMAGTRVDLRDCVGPGQVVTVDLSSVMGGVRVLVGPGVRVEDKLFSIMGGHRVDDEARGDGSNGTVVLRGLAMMGGVHVRLALD